MKTEAIRHLDTCTGAQAHRVTRSASRWVTTTW
jgi:hypothetical protein